MFSDSFLDNKYITKSFQSLLLGLLSMKMKMYWRCNLPCSGYYRTALVKNVDTFKTSYLFKHF